MTSKLKNTFLKLVRLGIGHDTGDVSECVDWSAIRALAERHGLSAVVLDGVDKLSSKSTTITTVLSAKMKLEWIGEVLNNYEARYSQYEKAVGSLAGWYNQHGFRMMVLKGYACSLDWPKPEHRPCGDIDIWLFGQQKEADKCLADSSENIIIDSSHHHHTVFYWKEFMIENHYDFINVHHHKSNAEFEAQLKELGKDDTHFVKVCGECLYLPSADLHALFLLKHMMMHFASEGIMLRVLLDWGFFVEKHGKEVNWQYVQVVLDRFNMRRMFSIINAICVVDLGFDASVFPDVSFDSNLKEKVLNEVLEPQYRATVPKNLFRRIMFKIHRWKDNKWKHELCYNESMWSAFWSGVWNHLMKPSSI